MIDLLISAVCGALIYVLLEHWLVTHRRMDGRKGIDNPIRKYRSPGA